MNKKSFINNLLICACFVQLISINLLPTGRPASADRLSEPMGVNVTANDMSVVLVDKMYRQTQNLMYKSIWQSHQQRDSGVSNCKGR